MAPATRSATRRASRWADLPPELVEAILSLMPLDDYAPFGLACKQWWSAMISVRSLFRPPPVLILKPCNPYNPHLDAGPGALVIDAQVTRFYSIRGGGNHGDIPVIRPIPFNICHGVPATRTARKQIGRSKTRAKAFTRVSAPATRCCGSSMGWLFMMDINDKTSVHLLNPISAEKVALPALPPYIILRGWDDVLCSKPASHQDCIVALKGYNIDVPYSSQCEITSHFTVLLTCRPKDDKWIEITYSCWVCTYAFCEARLYVISRQGMDIYNFDPYPRKVPSVMRKTWDLGDKGITLLAVVDGKLLCVSGARSGPLCVYEFVDNCRWMKIQSLGEWVLILNRFTSQAFSTKESPTLGFRANCIYQSSIDCILVYSMEDESFMHIPPPLPEAGARYILHTHAGYMLQAYWFLAQSWLEEVKRRRIGLSETAECMSNFAGVFFFNVEPSDRIGSSLVHFQAVVLAW